ncbi:hypothetical protein IPC624_31145, partial [Pseudomonas aeruginosa]
SSAARPIRKSLCRSIWKRKESLPLYLEAQYLAAVGQGPADLSEWIAKVAEIKARYPLPEAD